MAGAGAVLTFGGYPLLSLGMAMLASAALATLTGTAQAENVLKWGATGTSAATRVAALLSGEINFTNDAPVQDLPQLAAPPDVEGLEGVDLRTVMIGFPFRDALVSGEPNPFKEKSVRQALYNAIDPDLIQSRVMRGKSRTASATVAPPIAS